MSKIAYTAKNSLGRRVTLSSSRSDIRHMIFIRDEHGDWTVTLSSGKSQARIMAGLLRAHPTAPTILVAAATQV
jgi:hypothetical protein